MHKWKIYVHEIFFMYIETGFRVHDISLMYIKTGFYVHINSIKL